MRITFLRVVLATGVVGLLVVGWAVYSLFGPAPAIVVSRQTTFLTEPLGEDGLPDYGQALLERQRAGVTAENNCAIPFWQAMWPGELGPQDRYLLLAELGMSEPEAGLREPFQDIELRERMIQFLLKQNEQAMRAQGDESPRVQAEEVAECWLQDLDRPWTAQQNPPLAEWIEANEKMLDLLVEAGNRSHFHSPSPSFLDGQDESMVMFLLPSLQTIRSAVRLLSTRALLRIAEGRHRDAWNDLRACYGLSDLLAGQLWIIQEMVSIACAGIADVATLHLLDQPDLKEDLAGEILQDFKSRQLRNKMADVIDGGERLTCLDMVIRFSRGKIDDTDNDGVLRAINTLGIDWNLVLRDVNQSFDRIVAAARQEDRDKRRAELAKLEADMATFQPTPGQMAASLISRKRRSQLVGDALRGLFLPSTTISLTMEDRYNTQLDLMRLVAALAEYRAQRGEYPDTLSVLVPDMLEALPVDLFHESSFSYQKTNNGYLLYSLGPNAQDDGGSSERLPRYKGYRVEGDLASQAVVRQLLGEIPDGAAPSDGNTAEAGGAAGQADDLQQQIPPDADDHSIRLPRPMMPLPTLEP